MLKVSSAHAWVSVRRSSHRKAVNTIFHEVPRNEKPFLATAQARQGGVEAPYRGRGSITDTRRSNHQFGGAVAIGESTTRSIFDPLKPASGPGYFGLLDIRAPNTDIVQSTQTTFFTTLVATLQFLHACEVGSHSLSAVDPSSPRRSFLSV